jgi:GT2 family glycosyltransferase
MNHLAGKKVLCFIALPHHNRFLVPIMESLKEKGMEVAYFTTPAENAFEITLNQANLPYRHVLDYVTTETARRAGAAFQELRPVYQEKILRNRTLQGVPVVVQDKVIRGAAENYYSMDRMLEVEKPDLLFALHELNPWGKILGYLSHVHKIPYFTLQEGLYYCDTHYYRFHTDYSTACIVWGEGCRKILLAAGCSDDKVYPLGNTHIWYARQQFTAPAAQSEARGKLGIAADKKIVAFMMSHSSYHPFDARVYLRWAKARGDIVTVFKWHPVTGKETVDRGLENIKNEPSVISVHDFDTYALIGASDVCVTVGNSTTGLEALVFGKPLIEIRLPDQQYSYSQLSVAELAHGFEDISEKIEAIFAHGLSVERAQQVKAYLAHEFAFQDTGTLGRIAGLVEESLKATATAEPVAINSPANTRFPCTIVLPVDDASAASLLPTLESIAMHTAAELFEMAIVKCAETKEIAELLNSLGGDITVIQGQADWNYSTACNAAAAGAQGKYLVFLKPGFLVSPQWLEALMRPAEEDGTVGVVGGQVLSPHGLIWHLGYAFDVNQSPFAIYQMLPPEGSWAQRRREFRAVQAPFLVSRELFCRLGGFDFELRNRFEDVDFCLRVTETGKNILYTPECVTIAQSASWQSATDDETANRIRFFSKWTGYLWQDDEHYLAEDGLTHDALSALYRELAGRVAAGAKRASAGLVTADGN